MASLSPRWQPRGNRSPSVHHYAAVPEYLTARRMRRAWGLSGCRLKILAHADRAAPARAGWVIIARPRCPSPEICLPLEFCCSRVLPDYLWRGIYAATPCSWWAA